MFPKETGNFQKFNLAMARDSSRVVSNKIPGKEAVQFLMKLPDMGLKFKTATDIASQLVDERINKWKVVRRRTSQSIIGLIFFISNWNLKNLTLSHFLPIMWRRHSIAIGLLHFLMITKV
jgi:hypothetical protein